MSLCYIDDLTDQLMRVITSIADEIDRRIATTQAGQYSLCQALDQLIREHLSKFAVMHI